MDAGWDSWFEDLLRAELVELHPDIELEPDRPLVLYGLTSLGFLSLGEKLSRHYGVPMRLFVQRSFRSARSLWSFVTTNAGAQLQAVAPASAGRELARVQGGRSLAEHFTAAALRHPDATCLVTGATTISYRQLLQDVSALATVLRSQLGPAGAGAPPRVAVLGEREAAYYRSYLAVLYAGATVVPLSMESPPARNADIIAQAQVAVVVFAGDPAELYLAEQLAALGNVALLDSGVVPNATAPSETAAVPSETAAVPSKAVPPPPVAVSLDSLAYLLFTSGSTGRPKGVGVTHRNVDAFLASSLPRYGIGAGDVFSQIHELTFDLSVFELWGAWATAATLVAVPRLQALDPARTVATYGITVWTCTPSLMATAGVAGRIPDGSMAGVRYVAFCGEPLPEATATLTRRAAPAAIVDNTYGPTEATVWCTFHRMPAWAEGGHEQAGAETATGIVAIGTPCPGTEVLLLPTDGMPGEKGELCLAGEQVFAGYLDSTLDAAKFVLHDGRRWYRTGDLAEREATGVLRHLGRIDDQVKVRGFRIELAEVEHAAAALLAGRRAAAVAAKDCTGADGLVLFVEGAPVDGPRLRTQLASVLPSYMVPAQVRSIERLGMTGNGKLDRVALAALAGTL